MPFMSEILLHPPMKNYSLCHVAVMVLAFIATGCVTTGSSRFGPDYKRHSRVKDVTRHPGGKAVRLMLHRDDCRWDAVKCAHRNEVKFGSGSGWLGYSMMIPKGFEMGYTYIGQWHGGGLSSPTGAIVPGNDDVIVIKLTHLNNGWGEYFTIRGFKRGEWLDMVFHIKFSPTKRKAFSTYGRTASSRSSIEALLVRQGNV